MANMLRGSKFNGNIDKWGVSNIKDMMCLVFESPLRNNTPKWYMS